MKNEIYFGKEKWFLETSFPGVRRAKRDAFRIDKEFSRAKTKFQEVYVFQSPGFGKTLVIDGIIQFSQSDEFIYHEIIAHVPLLSHKDPKRLLVVGGGDGGVLREARKHPLKEMYFVDIDKDIVEVSKKHLPFISKGAFSDKRLKIFFEDGKKFIRRHKDFFDVVIVDSTDPVGPGKVLFTMDFYRDVFASLKKDGIAIFQLGPFLDFDLIIKPTAKKLKTMFSYVHPVRLSMPSYSCGCEYCFMIASKTVDPAKLPLSLVKDRFKKRLGKEAGKLKYYTPQVHLASMVMPKLWQI